MICCPDPVDIRLFEVRVRGVGMYVLNYISILEVSRQVKCYFLCICNASFFILLTCLLSRRTLCQLCASVTYIEYLLIQDVTYTLSLLKIGPLIYCKLCQCVVRGEGAIFSSVYDESYRGVIMTHFTSIHCGID